MCYHLVAHANIVTEIEAPTRLSIESDIHRVEVEQAMRSFLVHGKPVLKLACLLLISWCVMCFVHESGHIVCGWSCGGALISYDLFPWHLPYSIFDPDPWPLVTLWGGPLVGASLPLSVACLVRREWAWFVAYFCLLANGIYLALAWVTGDVYLDTPKLLEHGTHPATILAYCVLTIGFGYLGFRRHCVAILSWTDRAP